MIEAGQINFYLNDPRLHKAMNGIEMERALALARMPGPNILIIILRPKACPGLGQNCQDSAELFPALNQF